MAKKSTKTAHVLNLISKAAPEPQESAKNMDDTISKPEQPAASPIHSSLTQNTKNDEISKQIKDSLLQELGLQETTEENEQIETTEKDTPVTDAPVSDPASDVAVSDPAVSENVPASDASMVDHMVSEESNTESISEIENTSEMENKTSEVSLEEQIAESLSEELTEELQTASIQPVPHATPIKDILTDFSAEATSAGMTSQDTSEIVQPDTAQNTAEVSPVQEEEPVLASIPTNTTSSVTNSVTTDVPTTEFRYINIYEELVKEQLAEYMAKFHVCTCNRCTMDTMALTLSNLPSKYAVIDANLKAPFLNYCSIKLGVEIMTELTKACLVVAAHPRHTQIDIEANKE